MPETKTITVELTELVDNYVEDLLDIFNERGWPEDEVSGITYRAVGVSEDGAQIQFSVTAEPLRS